MSRLGECSTILTTGRVQTFHILLPDQNSGYLLWSFQEDLFSSELLRSKVPPQRFGQSRPIVEVALVLEAQDIRLVLSTSRYIRPKHRPKAEVFISLVQTAGKVQILPLDKTKSPISGRSPRRLEHVL